MFVTLPSAQASTSPARHPSRPRRGRASVKPVSSSRSETEPHPARRCGFTLYETPQWGKVERASPPSMRQIRTSRPAGECVSGGREAGLGQSESVLL